MGLLSQGSPLSWEETKRHADHVRRHGILQFLHIYHAVKDRHKDVLKWGDEVSARDPSPLRLPCQATLRRLCSARPYLRPQPRAPRLTASCTAPQGPRAPPRPGVWSLPSCVGLPGEPGASGPALSLPAGLRSPIHSLIWVFSFIKQVWIGHWEGAIMKKCDIWCFGEFTVSYTYLPTAFRNPLSHYKMRFCY